MVCLLRGINLIVEYLLKWVVFFSYQFTVLPRYIIYACCSIARNFSIFITSHCIICILLCWPVRWRCYCMYAECLSWNQQEELPMYVALEPVLPTCVVCLRLLYTRRIGGHHRKVSDHLYPCQTIAHHLCTCAIRLYIFMLLIC